MCKHKEKEMQIDLYASAMQNQWLCKSKQFERMM